MFTGMDLTRDLRMLEVSFSKPALRRPKTRPRARVARLGLCAGSGRAVREAEWAGSFTGWCDVEDRKSLSAAGGLFPSSVADDLRSRPCGVRWLNTEGFQCGRPVGGDCVLGAAEDPAPDVLAFLADQLGLSPDVWKAYDRSTATSRRHVKECSGSPVQWAPRRQRWSGKAAGTHRVR